MTAVEKVQIYACKRLLNVSKSACNDAILGDCGRYPLYINTYKRCLKFWLRILKLPEYRLVKLSYEMLKHYDSVGHTNWVTYLRRNLYSNGFGYIWQSQSVENEKLFIYQYMERLKMQYFQTWNDKCSQNSKLLYYHQYKSTYNLEVYLSTIDVAKFRTALVKFRSSAHSLLIERGRHFGIEREYRYCVYCEVYVEDELHFLLFCPLYEDLRLRYLESRFTINPSIDKFIRLLSSQNETVIKNLAMYIFYAFKRRQIFIEGSSY